MSEVNHIDSNINQCWCSGVHNITDILSSSSFKSSLFLIFSAISLSIKPLLARNLTRYSSHVTWPVDTSNFFFTIPAVGQNHNKIEDSVWVMFNKSWFFYHLHLGQQHGSCSCSPSWPPENAPLSSPWSNAASLWHWHCGLCWSRLCEKIIFKDNYGLISHQSQNMDDCNHLSGFNDQKKIFQGIGIGNSSAEY